MVHIGKAYNTRGKFEFPMYSFLSEIFRQVLEISRSHFKLFLIKFLLLLSLEYYLPP